MSKHLANYEFEDLKVDSVTYTKSGNNSIEVEYHCGDDTYSEWLYFEAKGDCRKEAVRWWREHTKTAKIPAKVDRALAACGTLPRPTEITVMRIGQWMEIVDHHFDKLPPDTAIISTQTDPAWVNVDGVSYRKYEKTGRQPALEVTYFSGSARHRDWICFEHTGYPREKAAWWWKLHSDAPLPNTVDEALAAAISLPWPKAIQVKLVGKYSEIQRHRFGMVS